MQLIYYVPFWVHNTIRVCSVEESVILIGCCRKWDADLLDVLLPQLLPKLHGNTVRLADLNWKLAAVQGFLCGFHLQVYQQLSRTLVVNKVSQY